MCICLYKSRQFCREKSITYRIISAAGKAGNVALDIGERKLKSIEMNPQEAYIHCVNHGFIELFLNSIIALAVEDNHHHVLQIAMLNIKRRLQQPISKDTQVSMHLLHSQML